MVPRLFESVNVRVALDHLGGLPLFGLHTIDPKGWQFRSSTCSIASQRGCC